MNPQPTSLIPANDAARLAALRRYRLLDTGPEESFDTITSMMAEVFGVPLSFISLVDEQRVYYKSSYGGFPHAQVPREDSLCSHTILNNGPLIIENAQNDPCFSDGPYVAPEGGIRFYAGVPLVTHDGFAIGTVCIVDMKPRSFSEAETRLLERFAWMAGHEIETHQLVQHQAGAEKQLNESNEELRFVTDLIPQLVWATQPDGYSYYFNSRWLEYTGLSFDDVKGDGWTQSLHPDDLESTLAAWRNAVERSEAYDVEYRLRGSDGTYRWFMARGTPMMDDEGRILRWYGTTTDIHEQKRAEEELEQKVLDRTRELSEAQASLRAIVDNAPIGLMVYTSERDASGKIADFRMLDYNARGNELTGISKEDRERLPLSGLLKIYGREWQLAEYVEWVEQRRPAAWEQYVEATGKWLWVTVTPLNDGFLRTLSDITELKLSQQQVEQQSEFANSVLDSSINAVVALDAIHDNHGELVDFRIVKINKAFSTILGLGEEVLGLSHGRLFPGPHEGGVFSLYRQVLLSGEPERREIFTDEKDLNSWFDLSVVKRGENGLVVSFNNISTQRQAAI
ncbi:MAG: PAS domain S-box protein, partial [Chitinophagaceae bacterium]